MLFLCSPFPLALPNEDLQQQKKTVSPLPFVSSLSPSHPSRGQPVTLSLSPLLSPKLIVLWPVPLSACSPKVLIYFTNQSASEQASVWVKHFTHTLLQGNAVSRVICDPSGMDPLSFQLLNSAAADHGWQYHRAHTRTHILYVIIHLFVLSWIDNHMHIGSVSQMSRLLFLTHTKLDNKETCSHKYHTRKGVLMRNITG